ncbi:MAG TPA: radical SAM protein [Anaerolineae bacterium]|nr:radical SAM protein [Anaerolineae bacterium]
MAFYLSQYARIFQKHGHWWLFHSPTGIAAKFTDDFVETPEFRQLVKHKAVDASNHDVIQTMRQHSILVDEAAYEQEPALLEERLNKYIRNQESFELTLLPTEKCNFRCPYCYEDFQLGRMPRWVVDAVKRLITRQAARDGIKHIRLSWFGGEPLIARDIVFEITEHALDVARNRSLAFEGGMTTNGYYLDKATFVRLTNLQIGIYQVTLDGPPDVHNQSRILFSGQGTFDRIWTNLEDIHKSDKSFVLILRMNVHDRNYEAIKAWLPSLGQTFLREDKRFLLHFHTVFGENLANKASHQGMRRVRELYQIALTHHLPVDLGRIFAPLGSVCYAAKANNFVVRSNGDINKCTVAFGIPQNDVGRLTPDGELQLNDNYHLWVRDPFSHPSCRSCSLAYQCGGFASCPLQPILRGESKRYCSIYRDANNLIPLLAL